MSSPDEGDQVPDAPRDPEKPWEQEPPNPGPTPEVDVPGPDDEPLFPAGSP